MHIQALDILAVLSLIGAGSLLATLSWIDLKEGILPNELVLGFLSLGVVFHTTTIFHYISMTEMALGGAIGYGLFFTIYWLASRFYHEDALGLGDVKLIGAAGIWLGPYFILPALTIGALAGILHGLIVVLRTRLISKVNINLNQLSLPAGPGFAIGIIATAVYMFRDLPEVIWP